MPRRNLARRFEGGYGVSQSTLHVESKYLARELEHHLLLATNELREKLAERIKLIAAAEEELQSCVSLLPDRERLAIRSLVARDFWHMAMFYRTFLATSPVAEARGPIAAAPEEFDRNDEPLPLIPFKESLFD